MPRRHRKMKGGSIWDTLTGVWDKTKQATSSAYQSVTGSSTTGSYTPSSYSSQSYNSPSYNSSSSYPNMGGRRTKRRRGGYHANTSLTNLAAHASPFSGKTAQAHNWVGGKTRRHRKHRHSKSCKHRKH